jgi:hypothetical protein
MVLIIDACNSIVNISDDEKYNTRNYMASLKYMQNLHIFLTELKVTGLNLSKIKFLPTFKDPKIAKELSIDINNPKETKLELFKIKSKLFVEDVNLVQTIKRVMLKSICEEIILIEDDVLVFKLDSSKLDNIKNNSMIKINV